MAQRVAIRHLPQHDVRDRRATHSAHPVVVALVVSLALVSASAIATAIAMFLPSIFHHLGIDPAVGSRPLATVIQDIASVVIYIGFATRVL